MKNRVNSTTCPLCGGNFVAGRTTWSVDLGKGVLVVRDVPARVCDQCGDEWLDNATALALDDMAASARQRGALVEVLTMAA